MADLTLEDFSAHLGEPYDVEAPGGTVAITLTEATALPRSVREAGSFRLGWTGPSQPLLEQGIYTMRRGGEPYELFIVPLSCDASGSVYEAIFN
jgi:hypothetical protein